MRLVQNAGKDRVLDLVEAGLAPGSRLDVMTGVVSPLALEALRGAAELSEFRLLQDRTAQDAWRARVEST